MSNEKKAPNLHNVEFLRSAVKESDFPFDSLPQIVFAGKSNVGKSSVINKLLNRKNFARVSAQPGKTIHINYFTIDKAAVSASTCRATATRASPRRSSSAGAR